METNLLDYSKVVMTVSLRLCVREDIIIKLNL